MHITRPAAGLLLAALTAGLLAGCASQLSMSPGAAVTVTVTASPSPTSTPTANAPSDATAVAEVLADEISKVKKVVTITEDNDPNDKIGRPNGYVSAAVLFDMRAACSDGLGADCGATVEQWPTEDDAQARSEYIQTLQKEAPILGSEYDTVRGPFLLRVSGDIKPSKAKGYEEAFVALF